MGKIKGKEKPPLDDPPITVKAGGGFLPKDAEVEVEAPEGNHKFDTGKERHTIKREPITKLKIIFNDDSCKDIEDWKEVQFRP